MSAEKEVLTMADLIDRDALMKEICGNECGSVCDEECENVMCNYYDYIMDAPSVNRWISCSERLPEQEGLYLVTTTSGKVCIWSFYFALASKRPYFSGDEKVIAWMQRPDAYEPPEKEAENG
jgi:hypothetical protein